MSASRDPTFLIVDDEELMLKVIERFARLHRFQVVTCAGGREAIEYLQTSGADIALVDVRMPDINGLQVLEAIRQAAPMCRTVLMTGAPDLETAVRAVKMGAHDFLGKPLDLDRLKHLMNDVHDDAERRRKLVTTERDLAEQIGLQGIVGRGPAMEALFSLVRRLAPHIRAVLVTGETGVGKDLVARALRALGPRATAPFVVVNCSAIVPTLFETELFGHVRGAFTGANAPKSGLFETAHGGTLFLDEVGDLTLEVQAKLLRVLESGELMRVGATEPRHVDVHVIAATNHDLSADVEAGRFRRDLYYRLNVLELTVPPLRDRREDIPYLIASFVREFGQSLHKPLIGVTPEAEARLMRASWPGNVRQLRNVIERACLLADGEWVTHRDLVLTGATAPAGAGATVRDSAAAIDQAQVQRALVEANGNKKLAAARLGISRRALYRLLESRGLQEQVKRRRV